MLSTRFTLTLSHLGWMSSPRIVETTGARMFGLDDREVIQRRRYVSHVRGEIEVRGAYIPREQSESSSHTSLYRICVRRSRVVLKAILYVISLVFSPTKEHRCSWHKRWVQKHPCGQILTPRSMGLLTGQGMKTTRPSGRGKSNRSDTPKHCDSKGDICFCR